MSAEEPALKVRLLIVDDEPAILFALGDYLSRRGFAVDLAPSRKEGERLVVTSLYDLVIVDLRLGAAEPRGGLEILHLLRDSLSPAPAILLTAYGSCEVEAELIELGPGRLLPKPQPLARIAEEVAKLLQGRPPRSGRTVSDLDGGTSE
jgi:DNA-binding response OmpR family regulator